MDHQGRGSTILSTKYPSGGDLLVAISKGKYNDNDNIVASFNITILMCLFMRSLAPYPRTMDWGVYNFSSVHVTGAT